MRIALIAAFTALTMAGCGTSGSPQETPPASPVDLGRCGNLDIGTRAVTFGAQGNLAGRVAGTGRVGIVLAHQANSTMCQWLLNAKDYAEQGYRVLAFDFAGFGDSKAPAGSHAKMPDDVAAAAKFLRDDGATAIVLIGASMGGTAVLVAGTTIEPPVKAVIALSAPNSYRSTDASEAVPKLKAPVLYVAGAGESGFSDSAKTLHAYSVASPNKQLVLVPNCNEHGVSLVVMGGGFREATDALASFLKTHAPVT